FHVTGVQTCALPIYVLADALDSDVYVVFGASYIRGPLIDYLVARGAINIHMGVSPYYRGSSCNFWALYDGRPEYVGATIHKLSRSEERRVGKGVGCR